MIKKVYKIGILFIFFILFVSECGFQPSNSSKDYAKIASTVSDFKEREQEIIARNAIINKELFEENPTFTSKTLFPKEWTVIWPDGTVVTIIEILDDNNTPEDLEDDIITLTKSYEIWEGTTKIKKIIRPRKPAPDGECWKVDEDGIERCIQGDISIAVFIEGIKTHDGVITLTWKKGENEKVLLEKYEKELFGLNTGGAVERVVIEIDDNGAQNKTKYRVRVTKGGDDVIVHSFVYEEIEVNGKTYTKITRDDGYYRIVIQRTDPTITVYYNPNDIFYMRVTNIRDKGTGKRSIIKEIYDEEGNLVDVKYDTIKFKFLGNEVIITKTFDNSDEIIIRIQEGEKSYIVNRNGLIYHVFFITNGVEIYDVNMNLIATVIFNEDGSWTIIYPDSSVETVKL